MAEQEPKQEEVERGDDEAWWEADDVLTDAGSHHAVRVVVGDCECRVSNSLDLSSFLL